MEHRVQQVIVLMAANLQQDLSLRKLARSVHLSPSRLRHLFRAETGTTPAQYFKRLRMRKAKELLETTLLSVKEIMKAVGMTDASHFVRDFKKIYGLSPSQHRARCYSNLALDDLTRSDSQIG